MDTRMYLYTGLGKLQAGIFGVGYEFFPSWESELTLFFRSVSSPPPPLPLNMTILQNTNLSRYFY